VINRAFRWYAGYLDRNPIRPANNVWLWRLAWRFYWFAQAPLAQYGAARIIDLWLLQAFIVEDRSKAMLRVYVGRSWIIAGRSIGKTFKIVMPFPAFDFAAALSRRRA